MELAPVAEESTDLEAELIRAYPSLARRLALVLRDAADAEDVAQAAFVRALERRSLFTGGDVRAWFYTLGLRLAFNELRRRRRSIAARVGHANPEPAWAMSTDPDLWLALGRLAPKYRAALVLSVLEGYTHEEIGRILGVPTGTVSSWISRTKARLQSELGG